MELGIFRRQRSRRFIQQEPVSESGMSNIGTFNGVRLCIAASLILLLAGCARSAPDLPDHRVGKSDEEVRLMLGISKSDLELSCTEISTAMNDLNAKIEENEQEIKGDRTQNQVAGYFGALFLFPALAADQNTDSKEQLDSLQVRKDQLIYLQQRKCK